MSKKKKILIAVVGVEVIVIAAVIAFLFYINSDTVKANRQLELAQRYLLEEDYEQAIVAFEVVIEIDPKNAEAYLGLAEAYEATDDIENAVRILEKGSKRTDSDEIRELLKEHKEEIEKKELAAQRAAEAAQEEANVSQTNGNSSEIAAEVPAAQPEEATPVTTGFVVMQDGEICYYDEQGNLVTGWFEVGNNRYCARIDGRLYKDGEYEVDSTKYQFASSGICLGEVTNKKERMPFDTTLELIFSSGVGAWFTEIDLNPDGSFSGYYHDSDMGDTGEGYPGGTVYFCEFSGKFDDIKQVNEHTYSMTLSELVIGSPIGEEWIEDEILYIASEPYGIEDGKEFLLYTPETPLNELSEEFLSWWPGRWSSDSETKRTLSCYGLYNNKTEYGFFD